MSARLLVALALLSGGGPLTEGTAGAHDCVPQGAEAVAVSGCRTSLTGWVQCDAFPSSGAPSPGNATLVLDCQRARWGNRTVQHCCAKLQVFKRSPRGRCRERLAFRHFTVGWAAYDDSPGFIDIVEVHILKNVTNLNLFWYDSSDDRFWDFSSPVFSAPNGSLSSVEFNKPERTWERNVVCEISLDNIYHLRNTSIDTFYLSFNWKNSTNLKLGQMPKLKTFTLSGTSVQHFPPDAHLMMPGLEELTLRNNAVLLPPPGGLSLPARLVSLDLSGTPVGDLSGWLPPLPRLRRLQLRGSGLCCLAEQRAQGTAFHSVPALQELDISGNALTTLGAALRELHSLRRLDASHNYLLELPQLHILGRASLDFSHNRVHTPPHCSSLAPGNHTLHLDLTRNQVSSWDATADMLRCVKALNLAHNSLATLSDGMLSSLNRVREVDLLGNPLDCSSCPLLRLRMWLLETPARVLPEDRALTCKRPTVLFGQPVRDVATQPGACDRPVAVVGVSRTPLVVAVVAGLSACGALLLVAAGCYRYRFEIAYSAHLIRLRTIAGRRRREEHASGAEHFLFDAFILYSGSDRSWVVGTLVPLLENGPQRYRICLHERDFQLGTVIVQNISSSMDRSRHTIVVLSRSFLSSRWCRWEMDLANHRTLDPSQREFIILLELEPLERSLLPRHLRFLMDTRTYLEWHQAGDTHYEDQAFRRLKRALGPRCFTSSDSSRC